MTEDEFADYISIIGDSVEGSALVKAASKDLSSDVVSPVLSWTSEGLNTTIQKCDVLRIYLTHINLPSLKLFARDFTKLNTVNVSFNNLKELDGFACFENLLFLDISHNKITSLSFATNLSKLTILRCHNNLIESLEELKHMPLLKELWTSNNKIQWQQYINLSSLKQLEVFVKSDKEKASEETVKIDSFVTHLAPSIRILDGSPVASTIEQAAPIDVKIMLTQARALLQVSDQYGESFKGTQTKKPQKGSSLQQTSKKSPSSLVSSKRSTPLTDEQLAEVESSGLRRGQKQPPKDSESQSLPDRSSAMDEEAEAAAVDASVTQKARGSRSTMAAARKIPKKFVGPAPEKEPSKEGEAALVVKFSSKLEDSPIALSVQSNGDGYMRWSRGGPMACSAEAGRLLACYRASGSVACVFDRRSFSGSVMDPRGRCVLVVSEQGSARTLDKAGGTIAEFHRGAPAASEALEWTFEGLRMKFDPVAWEVTVALENDKVRCLFSSVSGCSLLQEKPDLPAAVPKRGPAARKTPSSSSAPHQAEEQTESAGPNHEELRQDLRNLLQGLDGVLGRLRDGAS